MPEPNEEPCPDGDFVDLIEYLVAEGETAALQKLRQMMGCNGTERRKVGTAQGRGRIIRGGAADWEDYDWLPVDA